MKFRYLPLLALALPACTSPDTQTTAAAADARFDQFKKQFILDFWRQNPDYASAVGFHKYDSLLVIPNEAQRRGDAAFIAKNLGALGSFGVDSLSPNNQIDLHLLTNELRSERWYADTLRSWQWNPASYNLGASVGDLLNGRYYPLARRLRNISDKLAQAPAYYAAAQANIHQPTREHTQLAVQQNEGGLAVFGTLADSVRKSTLSAEEKQLASTRIADAQKAVRGYLDFLQKDVLATGGQTSARSASARRCLIENSPLIFSPATRPSRFFSWLSSTRRRCCTTWAGGRRGSSPSTAPASRCRPIRCSSFVKSLTS